MTIYHDQDALQHTSADVALLLAASSLKSLKHVKDVFDGRIHRFQNDWSDETNYPLNWAFLDNGLLFQDICLQEAVRATSAFFQQSDNLYAQKNTWGFFLTKTAMFFPNPSNTRGAFK